MSDFSADIKHFYARALEAIGVAREGIIISLFNSVILDTHVDTGRAISNWQTPVEQPIVTTAVSLGVLCNDCERTGISVQSLSKEHRGLF